MSDDSINNQDGRQIDDPQITQARIDELQAMYHQWRGVHTKLVQAQQDWQTSIELMNKLKHFYFEGEYRAYFEQIEQGSDIDLTTQSDYSVMGEDTIWNALHEHERLLWEQLQMATTALAPKW